ncbi:hypothetical protein LCGC14_0454310 [marine sediment metagenome]|uniref:Uncharacterized protein n=1 Tax=marine sediment metagenome TaxID=412755 RepID=A0A0F9SLZ1_9ZZZZ
MAQNLHQVPPNLEVWEVQGEFFLMRTVPDTDPPIYLVWSVASDTDKQALGITRADRVFSSWGEFYTTGALRQGNSTELLNTTKDPWDQIVSNYEAVVRVKPWMADPEILALWLGAAMEGRKITDFTTAVFDLVPLSSDLSAEAPKDTAEYYFRPFKTLLLRTVADGGRSFYIRGDHRATIPALHSLIVSRNG